MRIPLVRGRNNQLGYYLRKRFNREIADFSFFKGRLGYHKRSALITTDGGNPIPFYRYTSFCVKL
jgi:hypothetical protein